MFKQENRIGFFVFQYAQQGRICRTTGFWVLKIAHNFSLDMVWIHLALQYGRHGFFEDILPFLAVRLNPRTEFLMCFEVSNFMHQCEKKVIRT